MIDGLKSRSFVTESGNNIHWATNLPTDICTLPCVFSCFHQGQHETAGIILGVCVALSETFSALLWKDKAVPVVFTVSWGCMQQSLHNTHWVGHGRLLYTFIILISCLWTSLSKSFWKRMTVNELSWIGFTFGRGFFLYFAMPCIFPQAICTRPVSILRHSIQAGWGKIFPSKLIPRVIPFSLLFLKSEVKWHF